MNIKKKLTFQSRSISFWSSIYKETPKATILYVFFLWIQTKPKNQTKLRFTKIQIKHERDQISAKRLTAGHTECSEIGVESIETKESSASSGFEERGRRDADEVARGEEERENHEKNQCGGATQHALATISGKVGWKSVGKAKEDVLLFLRLGFVVVENVFVAFAVRVAAAGGECSF